MAGGGHWGGRDRGGGVKGRLFFLSVGWHPAIYLTFDQRLFAITSTDFYHAFGLRGKSVLTGMKRRRLGAATDDAMLLHRNLDTLNALHEQTQDWLQQVGLQCKPRETRFTHTLHCHDTVYRAHDTGHRVEKLHGRKRSRAVFAAAGSGAIRFPDRNRVRLEANGYRDPPTPMPHRESPIDCTLDTSLSDHLLWCSSDIVHAWFSCLANCVVPCPTPRLACGATLRRRACGKTDCPCHGREQRARVAIRRSVYDCQSDCRSLVPTVHTGPPHLQPCHGRRARRGSTLRSH